MTLYVSELGTIGLGNGFRRQTITYTNILLTEHISVTL